MKKYRVGIYLRLSDEDRNKQYKSDDSESIKNQRNLLLMEIGKHDDFVLVGEYCDENLSGAGTYRPQFERLIRDCEDGKLDIVLCKSQSRFSRDMEIVERYINNKFYSWGVRFIGLSDNADTDVVGNKKSRQINGLVNEWYLEDVSNNIRSAFRAKMKKGEFISPFAPFGYVVDVEDNNRLLVDDEVKGIVRDIFGLYLNGLGFMGIANNLNERGIPSPSLYKFMKGIRLNVVSCRDRDKIKWNANAVRSILTNEVYIGNLVQGKRTTVSYKNHKIKWKNSEDWIRVSGCHEAIIDEDTFFRVQKLIRKRHKSLKSTGAVHKLSGKVFCAVCGNGLRKKNNGKYSYLVCGNGEVGNCSNVRSIRYDILEDIVLGLINEKVCEFFDYDFISSVVSGFDSEGIGASEIKNKIKGVRQKLEGNKEYLKCLYEDKVKGVIDDEKFLELSNLYDVEKEGLDRELQYLINEMRLVLDGNNVDVNGYRKFSELNRIIIIEFIKKIWVGELDGGNRDVRIEWDF